MTFTDPEPRVRLIWCTPDPLRAVAVAARMTYSSLDVETLAQNITQQEAEASLEAVTQRGHWSVLRHVVFMFSVANVSRSLSHQLVRHTVGHSFEQRSQHYRTERSPKFIEPETIQENEDATFIFEGAALNAQTAYETLLQQGVPKDDARAVLPNATETQLVWTANLEALMAFIQTRACRVNTPEIMSLAIQARRIVLAQIPLMARHLGPTCFTRGVCYEGAAKFHKACEKPWRSPTVLWTPDFPSVITLVSVGGEEVTFSPNHLLPANAVVNFAHVTERKEDGNG